MNDMNSMFAVWVALYGLAALGQPASSVKYYEVSGRSVAELRQALDRLRPAGPDGKGHDALTTWYVRWRYRTAATATGCEFTSFDTSLETNLTMPKWTTENDAPAALVQLWRDYMTALLVHEEGHKTIGVAAATAIGELRDKVSRQMSCVEMRRTIDKTANDLLEQYRAKERHYDAETSHGRTQGARFP
jgi:predicted secreted Zn-dependent protease